MPTALDYEVYAIELSGQADELTGSTAQLVGLASPEAIAGGLAAVTVDVAVRAAQANTLTAAGLLRELADECTRRAQICAEYAAAMVAYEQRQAAYRSAMADYVEAVELAEASGGGYPGSPPWPPSEPQPPYPWVER